MKSTSSSRMVISLSSEVVSTDSHAAYRLLVGGSGVEVVVRRSRSGGFGFPPGDGDGGDVGLAWGWRAGDAHGRARGRPWLLTRRHGLVPSHAMTFWAALRYSGRNCDRVATQGSTHAYPLGDVVQICVRIIVPVLLGLAVLSVRGRVKR